MSLNQVAKKKCGRPQKNIDMTKVLELVKAGKTDQEIVCELDVSARSFRTFRKKHGISSAAGHGGTRRGAGRKKFTGDPGDEYMRRQQAIDAKVNSLDAGLRIGRLGIHNDQWLKWAGSAFEFDYDLRQYVCKLAGFGIPAVIRQKGVG
jgi:hypothetical protein